MYMYIDILIPHSVCGKEYACIPLEAHYEFETTLLDSIGGKFC